MAASRRRTMNEKHKHRISAYFSRAFVDRSLRFVMVQQRTTTELSDETKIATRNVNEEKSRINRISLILSRFFFFFFLRLSRRENNEMKLRGCQ